MTKNPSRIRPRGPCRGGQGHLADPARDHDHHQHGLHLRRDRGVVLPGGRPDHWLRRQDCCSGFPEMAHRWYVVHAYSGFENKVAQSIREQAEQEGPGRGVLRGHGADRGGRRGAPRRQGQDRAQVLPRLCAGEDGSERRDLAPGQEHRQGDRLPGRRRPRQAGADLRRRGRPHPAARSRRASSGPSPRSASRSASRSRWPTARSPRSTARSRMSTRNGHGSRSRCRSSAAPPRSSSTTLRWKSSRMRRAP